MISEVAFQKNSPVRQQLTAPCSRVAAGFCSIFMKALAGGDGHCIAGGADVHWEAFHGSFVGTRVLCPLYKSPSTTPLQWQKEEGPAKWCRLEARAFKGTWGPKWSCPSAACCTGGHTSSSVGSGSAQPGSTQYCGSALAFRDLLFSTTWAFCIQMKPTVGRMKKQNKNKTIKGNPPSDQTVLV